MWSSESSTFEDDNTEETRAYILTAVLWMLFNRTWMLSIVNGTPTEYGPALVLDALLAFLMNCTEPADIINFVINYAEGDTIWQCAKGSGVN